jgi:hypothetical protein
MSTIATILKLTAPNEYFMDAKSGAIFRPRPFYFALETVAIQRMRRNLITDDVPQRLIETKTTIADVRRYLLERSKGSTFIKGNYLPLIEDSAIGVAGKYLSQKPVTGGDLVRFYVSIPARYTIIDEHGRVAGVLDETPLDQTRDLASGGHSFSPSSPHAQLTLVLAKAVDLGYRPRAPEAVPKSPAQ